MSSTRGRDLFAVGVVLYELLAGERPWGAVRGVREMRAVVERAARPSPRAASEPRSGLALAAERLLARDASRIASPPPRTRCARSPLSARASSDRCASASLVVQRCAHSPCADIFCHGSDLTTRNEFHNGNAQKKGKRWIDHDLSHPIKRANGRGDRAAVVDAILRRAAKGLS